jgi:hypothetical protein
MKNDIDLIIAWLIIGWIPMGALGFGIGLIWGHLTNQPAAFTTGGALIGMFLYIPLGIIADLIHLKRMQASEYANE